MLTPSESYYDTVIYVDCSAWESRRVMQRKMAEELNLLDSATRSMFDKQNEEDDFDGVGRGSRDIITSVSQVIAQTLMYMRCMMLLLNGSNDEILLTSFGVNPDYCDHITVWAFTRRSLTMRMHDRCWERSHEERADRLSHQSMKHPCPEGSKRSQLSGKKALNPPPSRSSTPPASDPLIQRLGCTGHSHPIAPTTGETPVLKQLQQERPGDRIKGTGNVDFQKHATDLLVVKKSASELHRSETVMYGPSSDKSTLVLEDQIIQFGSQSLCEDLSHQFTETMHQANGPVIFYRVSSPPFLDCCVLRFLGMDHGTHDTTNDEGENSTIKWRFLHSLLVLDIRYTEWDDILSEEKMDLMAGLMELNIEGAAGSWKYTSRLQGRLPHLRRLRITKPTYQYQAETSTDGSSNSFLGKTELEILDFSGDKGMRNMPTSLSTSSSLQVLILDDCDGLENVVLPDGLPSSLTSFSFDGYGPMAGWASSFKPPPESSRPNPQSGEDKRGIKTSMISLQGCTQLENLFIRALPNLVEIDLSGSAMKLLDLNTMVVDVPNLRRLFLLGCKHLRAVKWGPHVKTVLDLEVVCIDTRPRTGTGRARGFTRPSLAQHKSFSLQLHAALADARLVRSLYPLVSNYLCYSKAIYLNLLLSCSTEHCEGIELESDDTEMSEPSNQQHHVLASRYSDVFTEIIGNGNAPMLVFPKPPAQRLDHHVEIGDGSRCLESELEFSRKHLFNLRTLMKDYAESVHVHHTSVRTCTPASAWHRLKWCRVERCPNLDTVFPAGAEVWQSQLQTIWASNLPMARCIWSKGSKCSFMYLQHLCLRACPRLQFALPVWVDSFPNLETLHVISCSSLEHILVLDESNPEKITETGVSFPKLTTILLHDLPKLEQIMSRVRMLTPTLETIKIRGCFALRWLPTVGDHLHTKKPDIEMEKDVWDALEWDGVEAGHHPNLFEQPVHSRYYRRCRLLRGTVLR
ncbi:hypothetical protein U9M48_000774 [Paspalum notatum var. saurae]|uniref:Disease resistance protein At4g27190-like leucine-rich repeats domain-containing protein n=1 Tax=Paspalum notatum var. saurae TaxID=547442 RepID=A0AAQ3PF66_PASNO